MKTLLITGGAGFIGCNFVRLCLQKSDSSIVVLDKLSYAGNLINLKESLDTGRVTFVQGDINDRTLVKQLFQKYRFSGVFNFAAETHVDRSIDGPTPFIETNILGTFVLLEETRHFFSSVSDKEKNDFRFLHVSTDEVYGSLGASGFFTEETPYAPNSPYSASKAGADHLVRSYFHTYGIPTVITNCSNNYGPHQFPEKLIPLMILNALDGKNLPIYGDGGNIRDWIYVDDHCEGLWAVFEKGSVGEKFNIGARTEKNNVQVVDAICRELNTRMPEKDFFKLKTFVKDRPGHDRRYAIDPEKMEKQIQWRPLHSFDEGISKTVEWYLSHRDWCAEVQKGKYERQRLGLI